MRTVRGNAIAMIFQEPMTSLNPVLTVGHQIAESIPDHQGKTKEEARIRAGDMLELVKIPDARKRLDDYPHQFSRRDAQRVMIAMALACNPRPAGGRRADDGAGRHDPGADPKLMLELKERTGAAVILITHDLGVVAETCQRVMVMYAGRKIEEASVEALFDKPAHPYTARADGLDSAAEQAAGREAAPVGDPRHGAEPAANDRGALRLRAPLRPRHRAVPDRDAGPQAGRAGTHRGLPLCR